MSVVVIPLYMDTKSKILIVLLVILIVLSVSATYYRFFVFKDYETFFDNYDEEALDSTTLGE